MCTYAPGWIGPCLCGVGGGHAWNEKYRPLFTVGTFLQYLELEAIYDEFVMWTMVQIPSPAIVMEIFILFTFLE